MWVVNTIGQCFKNVRHTFHVVFVVWRWPSSRIFFAISQNGAFDLLPPLLYRRKKKKKKKWSGNDAAKKESGIYRHLKQKQAAVTAVSDSEYTCVTIGPNATLFQQTGEKKKHTPNNKDLFFSLLTQHFLNFSAPPFFLAFSLHPKSYSSVI